MKTKAKRPRRRSKLPAIENYTDEQIARFLLNNSVDAADYALARQDVRKLGLDPDKIRHTKPYGGK